VAVTYLYRGEDGHLHLRRRDQLPPAARQAALMAGQGCCQGEGVPGADAGRDLCRLAVKCQTGVEAATARSPSAHLAEGEGCQYAGAAGCPSLSGSGSLAAAEFD
jgi:hypothetical protein